MKKKIQIGLLLIALSAALSASAYDKADIDKMTSYAVILGRAAGCGIDTDQASRYVGKWFDSRWPRRSPDQGIYVMILAEGIKMHFDEQRSGRAPDSCSEVRRQFNFNEMAIEMKKGKTWIAHSVVAI